MRRITRIIVHHSASPFSTTTAAKVRAWHTAPKPVGRGWSDIGYHYVIDRYGVHLGRPEWVVGAHDLGQNAESIGVCFVGNWTPGHDGRTPWATAVKSWRELVVLVADLCARYGLDATDIEGHNENEPRSTPTACPGFPPHKLRAEVAKVLDGYKRTPEAYPSYQEST